MPWVSSLTANDIEQMRKMYASGAYTTWSLGQKLGRDPRTIERYCKGLIPQRERDQPFKPPEGYQKPTTLYLSDVRGDWWPGIDRQCGQCGGRLHVEDDEVRCWSCSRVAYMVQARRRPSNAELFASDPPRGPGRPRGIKNQAHCKRGHARTEENTYRNPGGYVQCRDCHRAIRNARASVEVRA